MSERRYANSFYRGLVATACGLLAVIIAMLTDRVLIGLIFGVPIALAGVCLTWIGWRASDTSR